MSLQQAMLQAARDDDLRPEYRDLFRKTVFCRFFPRGMCSKGTQCKFAHSIEECQAKPDLTKTALCRQWKHGMCPYPAEQCQFAHGHQELRRPRPLQASPPNDVKDIYPNEANCGMNTGVATKALRPLVHALQPPLSMDMPKYDWDAGATHEPSPEYIPSPKWCYTGQQLASQAGASDLRPLPPQPRGGTGSGRRVEEALHRAPAPEEASSDLVRAIAKLLKDTSSQSDSGMGMSMRAGGPQVAFERGHWDMSL